MAPDPSLELPAALAATWAAVVGACVGSFLNVVIARVPAGLSIVRPGSRCPRCQKAIRWYDNVPVLAWLWLRARCRDCGAPISARYPAVELLGLLAGLGAWARHGLTLAALAEFVLVMLLLALSAIDLDTWSLPHELTVPLLGLGLLAGAAGLPPVPPLARELVPAWLPGWVPATAVSAALGAAVGAGLFWLVRVVGGRLARKEALGLGDVVLLGAIGAWLGLAGLLPVILLASTQGAVAGILLLALGRGQTGEGEPQGDDGWVPPRNSVPFGPFLALAALEWLYLAPWLARHVALFEVFGG
ncbi:MAG: prepilin peptidase [Anaeromyxobacter sp.]